MFLSSPRKKQNTGLVRAAFLIYGFVRGGWRIEQKRDEAMLLVQPFEPLSAVEREACRDEGERLLRFVAPDAHSTEIRFD